MNEQRVELFIKDRKYSFMIPFNDYVPFKKAEKKIINLIENIEHTEEQLDNAIVYSALQLAIENEKLITKESDDKAESDDEISQLININFPLNYIMWPRFHFIINMSNIFSYNSNGK